MTRQFSDFATATKMRDIMEKIAASMIDKMRPRHQYAKVINIGTTTCTVEFPGESGTEVEVAMGSVRPLTAGQKVRIGGVVGDRYVDDVIGGGAKFVGYTTTEGSVSDPVFVAAGTSTNATHQIITYARTGDLTVTTGSIRFLFPFACTLISVTLAINTAPTGASAIVDVNRNGSTIFTTQGNRPTLTIGSFKSGAAIPDVTSMLGGDYLTVDIDQIGSTIAGADMTVIIRFKAT